MKRMTDANRNAALQPYEQVARVSMFGRLSKSTAGQPGDKEMQIARKNHVGLEFISHYPAAVSQQTSEQEKYRAFQSAMEDTSMLLDRHGIAHIYIKFRKQYLYYDSNVDVIVGKEQWAQTCALLKEKGYSGHVMFKEPDKIMFSKPEAPVSIHLHPGVTWNGVQYFSIEELWENSLPSSDFAAREMTPPYDFLINIAHNLFENYDLSLGDVLYFKRMVERHSIAAGPLEQAAIQNGWGYGFRQVFGQALRLVKEWEAAEQADQIPRTLLAYPYRITPLVLAQAYWQRFTSNVMRKDFRSALREMYAYPSFYALQRRHDLAFLHR
jgi:hypothetical protein